MTDNPNSLQTEISRPNENDEFPTDERCLILESWNTEKDPSVSIARARVKPGITTQLHKINGITERYIIIQGTGEVKLGNMDYKHVQPGDIVIIPEGISQQIKNTGMEDLIFYCICTPRFIPDHYEALE